ncbi:MAG: hypothetical protein HYW27_01235 [Candidatus Aenigmarchaeota archaeon]|nr:hypothetical protein [Candidatus Aenigmarchaeota archaeon]
MGIWSDFQEGKRARMRREREAQEEYDVSEERTVRPQETQSADVQDFLNSLESYGAIFTEERQVTSDVKAGDAPFPIQSSFHVSVPAFTYDPSTRTNDSTGIYLGKVVVGRKGQPVYYVSGRARSADELSDMARNPVRLAIQRRVPVVFGHDMTKGQVTTTDMLLLDLEKEFHVHEVPVLGFKSYGQDSRGDGQLNDRREEGDDSVPELRTWHADSYEFVWKSGRGNEVILTYRGKVAENGASGVPTVHILTDAGDVAELTGYAAKMAKVAMRHNVSIYKERQVE